MAIAQRPCWKRSINASRRRDIDGCPWYTIEDVNTSEPDVDPIIQHVDGLFVGFSIDDIRKRLKEIETALDKLVLELVESTSLSKRSEKMKILTIQRSRWRRGGPVRNLELGPTTLRNAQNGLMCCLGFDALACGYTEAQIQGLGDPSEVAARHVCLPGYENRAHIGFFDIENSPIVEEAIDINDNPHLSDDKREAKLIPVLKQLGWDDVVFVD